MNDAAAVQSVGAGAISPLRCVVGCLALMLSLLAGLTAQAAPQSSIVAVDNRHCNILKQHVLRSGAPVQCQQLRVVRLSYIDFDNVRHDDGEIMVMAAVAPHVQAIFDTLLKRGFPLARVRLMEHYQGDDDASMADNNTSALNDRPITGGKAVSLHAYGLAIDLNPLQNPYVQREAKERLTVSPPAGQTYAKRIADRPGSSEQVVELFAQHGFLIWGGDWKKPIDYQHFQVSRSMAERMAKLPIQQARQLFENSIVAYRACRTNTDGRPKDRAECAAAK